MTPPTSTVPVAVLAGFLGAGKTTLLNGILTGDHGLRVGVIVNDFGSLAFDEELAGTVATHQRLLANGCVCCSIQSDLLSTLDELLAHDPPLDAILVEASGVADPQPLVATLIAAGARSRLRLAAVVTVADAERVREQEQDYGGELVLRQVRAASVVVLNKCDLVTSEDLAETCAWLHRVGAPQPVLTVVHADVPLDVVLRPAKREPTGADRVAAPVEFAEWTLRTERCFDAEQLRRVFDQLPAGIVRAKGVVAVPGGAGRLLVQYAGGRLSLSALGDDVTPSSPRSQIVVIGARQMLDPAALEHLFLG